MQAEAKRDGFRPLAQLAAEKKWWAIKNICRRRKFLDEDISMAYLNLTVVQWAEKHGEQAMAKELRYFLVSSFIFCSQSWLFFHLFDINEL